VQKQYEKEGKKATKNVKKKLIIINNLLSAPRKMEQVTFASEKMAPRFDDPFRHTNFDQRISYNAYMKTMVKNEQPCSSRIFLAALVQIL